MRVLLLHGPNLNLLGTREPGIYGSATLGDLEDRCRGWAAGLGIEIEAFQSNHEGALIDRIHAAVGTCAAIIINPGALSHYSYALHDAIKAVDLPTVEVHLSDITAREEWRARSVTAPACAAVISGRGADGYRQALEMLAERR
ncbi:MAG: type II 3-dehydroquinate dehydratase [Actinobacteria bacterium]|nr:type II 3-dehydroquinate dehydratase [Actinomycetota bacterium]MBU1492778.1 type II 3-dehydroquinate dehydratase [Actinomycetota bacterium]